jgi:hypothetical protein
LLRDPLRSFRRLLADLVHGVLRTMPPVLACRTGAGANVSDRGICVFPDIPNRRIDVAFATRVR